MLIIHIKLTITQKNNLELKNIVEEIRVFFRAASLEILGPSL
jgi:hypothetical protein